MKPAIEFFERVKEHCGDYDPDTAFAIIRTLFEMAPTQQFRDELTAITGTVPNQDLSETEKHEADIDLQTWSELMTAIGYRDTPYEELTEFDQVTDRMGLEKFEQLYQLFDPAMKAECLAIINKKLGR